ncbi:1-acyl-sn-glycerol-3-phosphate acyltransferase [Sphingomonas sp. NSE70-1]|uniref:1-acyl-sn-glycerol-3-phosphate acyltransferase n=2 Tax=Sphingomonas caseinilyticus TaxID=2908205 RepID=A0ABT0RUX1_9SPHN|nr:lysophospholipid acyltransferase family protein [Sphingomonas caseinilyticus]MCL6698825.1 1-acyl-sn-glycerol-3-phosphate acyltransferase [Sphingomonas caseinilyticus]
MMTWLRSLLFALLFYPGTLIYVLTVIAVAPIGDRPVQAVVHAWSAFHHWLVRNIVGIRMEWDGEIPDGAYLIAVKHQSMMEAVDTLHFANTPVVVMKRELTVIPLFGWVTRRYGVIGVDRDAGASALRAMMAEAKAAIAGGRPVLIFPEGTRVAHGESPPLQPGFAGLYRALGLPVVPVAHDVGRLWHKGFLKRSGTVHFKVGEVIPAGLKRDEIERRVHEAINALN